MLLQPGDNDCSCVGASETVVGNKGASLSGSCTPEPVSPLANEIVSPAIHDYF